MQTLKYESYTIEIVQDADAGNPREEFDNMGEILYVSNRYTLGDRQATKEEIDKITRDKNELWLPVYAYIHSGTRINTTGFSCPWDSGQCGIIHMSKKAAVHEYGVKYATKSVCAKALKYMCGEIETFDQYLNGDVHGYRVIDEHGEELDSCWGFYGYQYCQDEALESAKWHYEHTYHQAEMFEEVECG